jgi:hypothetical protein
MASLLSLRVVEPGQHSAGTALLSTATDLQADLLVMEGYTHALSGRGFWWDDAACVEACACACADGALRMERMDAVGNRHR